MSKKPTIPEKVNKAVHSRYHVGDILTRQTIIDAVCEDYEDTNRSSVCPSDFCDNITNKGLSRCIPIFNYLGRDTYELLPNTSFTQDQQNFVQNQQDLDFWVKIVEFLQQNWALLKESDSGGVNILFINDAGGIFDQLSFPSAENAQRELLLNGFKRYATDEQMKNVIRPPHPPFFVTFHPNGPIYSSGRYWKTDIEIESGKDSLPPQDKLADYVRSLQQQGVFIIAQTIDGNYNHMGATIADAVLQANMKYDTHVKPRVQRILNNFKDAVTVSAVANLTGNFSTETFLNWKGRNRIERFENVLQLLRTEGIETESDLKARFVKDQSITDRQDILWEQSIQGKLSKIEGIGPKTIDYLKILIGISDSAIDRHLLTFIAEAGISVSSYPSRYENASKLINETADLLEIDRAIFDHSIWHYMSEKCKKMSKTKSSKNKKKKN